MLTSVKYILILIMILLLSSCDKRKESVIELKSPNTKISMHFSVNSNGEPWYMVHHKTETIIDTSFVGFQFKNNPAIKEDLEIISIVTDTVHTNWKPVWGQQKSIENKYNEAIITLKETSNLKRNFKIVFRIYDDGLGFRYQFPKQEHLDELVITREETQFKLTDDADAWWIPADYDSYEHIYSHTILSKIDAKENEGYDNTKKNRIPNIHAVNTPLTVKTKNSIYLCFSEANLTDYSDMTLAIKEDHVLQSELVPWSNGDKVRIKTPFVTPWRTIQIAENSKELLTNTLILNLNEPSEIKDISWIEPMKYSGIWWEMHLGKSSWANKNEGGWSGNSTSHGATTINAKKYIDFNAKHGIKGVLIEGWNTGWEYWGVKGATDFFDYVTPSPDFDIKEVVAYAKEKGVTIIGHHETSGDVITYEKRLDSAFAFYSTLGINTVKTGYANHLIDNKEFHHGQYMVNHYRKVVETAAKYQITLDVHEPIKPTGIRRTYPNMMTREGVRGMEFNAWGGGNSPEHTLIIPFTRGLAGPIDYTPGIFDIKFDEYRTDQYVRTTLAKQLALYIILYSPLQMVADLPENYEDNLRAFQFIKDVPVDWDKTIVVNGKIGEYLTIARKDKNSSSWFIGSITNQESRDLELSFEYLDHNKKYIAELYLDGDKAHYLNNPTAFKNKIIKVNHTTLLNVSLASGGGMAIHIKEVANY
ncbi:glycoside hydrolase family 97 protein [Aquimarina macrocephali]|uniref:glycoside hydrolase family 97 protein n=1 Tax=Aquimarina macrocephali TaxID=666563 RepID=UPI0004662964|nr:glycoside hydrolase family 97 protein [Aquimarina macrocephali]